MKYYLGIDGGGTKTTAVVSDETGKILCKKEGKTINFYGVGMEKARENLLDVVKAIENELGEITFSSAFIGCSALDSEADEEITEALCGGIIKSEKIGMNSDLYVALKSANANAVAVCGTGSMAIGEKEDGEIIIKGGWGHILGDEGSAYSISLKALKLLATLCDKGEENELFLSALDFFGVNDFRGVIDVVYSEKNGKDYIASFGKIIGELAEKGNTDALKIIKKEATAFGETVKALIKDLGKAENLSLYGGVFENNGIFRDEFIKLIKEEYPQIEISLLTTPPEEGALKVAVERE